VSIIALVLKAPANRTGPLTTIIAVWILNYHALSMHTATPQARYAHSDA